MTDKEIILFCIQKIEEKFAHGSSSEWTHHHFLLLSETIEKKTEVIISATTLKRFFGKRSTDTVYTPQLGTREALSRCAGYSSWQDLTIAASNQKDWANAESSGKNKGTRKSSYLVIALILIASVFSFFILKTKLKPKVPPYQISIRNAQDTVPFTAVFDYQIPKSTKDTFFLHIPEIGKLPLSPDHNIFNQWFRYVGFFHATLLYNDIILDTLTIHAQNKKWQPGIWRYDDDGQFAPFTQTSIKATENGNLYVSPVTMQRTGIDSLSRYWSEFRLFKPFNTVLDDCTFNAVARNNDKTGGKPCYDIDIELVGKNGHIQVVFTQEKCFRYVKLVVSEINYDGRDNDLSFLSTDVRKWNSFKIAVKEKQASISINDKQVFQQKYIESLGELKGIIFRFYGSGQAESVELFDENGKLKFQDTFEE